MKPPLVIASFRLRLLLLLATLLGLTVGVQYYVNLRSARNNARLVAEQERAIMAGVGLGVNSLFSKKYLDDLRKDLKQPLLDENTGRVKNVLVVDANGYVYDSLIDDYQPSQNEAGKKQYVRFEDVPLPPISSAVEGTDESQSRPPCDRRSQARRRARSGSDRRSA